MSRRVRFIRVSYQQIASRVLVLAPRAEELATVFRVPCDVSELYVVSSIIARQCGLRRNFVVKCRDGRVFTSNLFDLGPGLKEVEPLAYIIKLWFGIAGWSGVKLDHVIRRCVALAIEDRRSRVTVLYSL